MHHIGSPLSVAPPRVISLDSPSMDWPRLHYERTDVAKAGKLLCIESATPDDIDWSFKVLNNWRACHSYPMNTFQATLRSKLARVDSDAIVAQRLKRAVSIIEKLIRYPSMKLHQMQDIAGLRAIVAKLPQARKLEKSYERGRLRHILRRKDDYITSPKASGYRSLHLIYSYRNSSNSHYDGLQIEVQIRTRLQHAWATAVETVGVFLERSLKSSEGPEEWLEFFSLTGSAFALREHTPVLGAHTGMSRKDVVEEVKRRSEKLRVADRLKAYSAVVNATQTRGAFNLIILDSDLRTVKVKPFAERALEEAIREYSEIEQRIKAGEPFQAVLVSAGPLDNLRKAYPSFFLDTTAFVDSLQSLRNGE